MTQGDYGLKRQLEGMRDARFERQISERTLQLSRQEAEEQEAASNERQILDSTVNLRNRLIELRDRHIRIRQATKIGAWLRTRRSIPDVRFPVRTGEHIRTEYDLGVSTYPLLATEEHTVEGKIIYGWVFSIDNNQSRTIGLDRAPVHISRAARDESTGLETSELWFTVNPSRKEIACHKLAKKRQELFPVELELGPDEDQSWSVSFDDGMEVPKIVVRNLDSEARERNRQRESAYQAQLKEQLQPDLDTGLELLGIIRGAMAELS